MAANGQRHGLHCRVPMLKGQVLGGFLKKQAATATVFCGKSQLSRSESLNLKKHKCKNQTEKGKTKKSTRKNLEFLQFEIFPLQTFVKPFLSLKSKLDTDWYLEG